MPTFSSEFVDQIWTSDSENQTLSLLNITRPDFLFASDWHDLGSGDGKNQAITTDTTMTLLGDHFASDPEYGGGRLRSWGELGIGAMIVKRENGVFGRI
ncbi:hypothetical protein VNO80_25645 [Phaseolus coccineus]|uniref:Uncharacterized protein n=1 Tax=Phaseolus coccineus TaxID=3886 RepID=A0AAN9LV60_PHACN